MIECDLMPTCYLSFATTYRCVSNAATTCAAKSATNTACWCITTAHISAGDSTEDSQEMLLKKKLLGVCVLKHEYILKLCHNFLTVCMFTCLQLGSRPLSNFCHSRARKHCRIASYIPIFHVQKRSLLKFCRLLW